MFNSRGELRINDACISFSLFLSPLTLCIIHLHPVLQMRKKTVGINKKITFLKRGFRVALRRSISNDLVHQLVDTYTLHQKFTVYTSAFFDFSTFRLFHPNFGCWCCSFDFSSFSFFSSFNLFFFVFFSLPIHCKFGAVLFHVFS